MGIVFIAAQLQKSLCEMYHHVAGWSVTKRQRHALTSRMRKLHDYQSPSIQRQEPRWSHHFSWCAWAAAIGWKGVCLEGGGRRCKIWSWSGFCDGIDPLFTKTMVLSMEVALCKNFSAYAYAIYAIVFRDKNSAVGVAENLGHRPDTRFNDSDFRLWSWFPQLCSEVFDSIAQTGKRGVKTPMFVCTRMVLIPIYLLILCFALVYYYIIYTLYATIYCSDSIRLSIIMLYFTILLCSWSFCLAIWKK